MALVVGFGAEYAHRRAWRKRAEVRGRRRGMRESYERDPPTRGLGTDEPDEKSLSSPTKVRRANFSTICAEGGQRQWTVGGKRHEVRGEGSEATGEGGGGQWTSKVEGQKKWEMEDGRWKTGVRSLADHGRAWPHSATPCAKLLLRPPGRRGPVLRRNLRGCRGNGRKPGVRRRKSGVGSQRDLAQLDGWRTRLKSLGQAAGAENCASSPSARSLPDQGNHLFMASAVPRARSVRPLHPTALEGRAPRVPRAGLLPGGRPADAPAAPQSPPSSRLHRSSAATGSFFAIALDRIDRPLLS